jgi:aminoglycoside 3-N-acetyltransferase I
MSNFSLRVLESVDLPVARELFEMWRREDSVSASPASDETLQRLLARDDFHVVAALRDGMVIGGLTAYELVMYTEAATELFVYEVGVAEEHRRQGIGRALIECARELCRARGLSELYVPAFASDERAVAFYQSCGLKREEIAWFSEQFQQAP